MLVVSPDSFSVTAMLVVSFECRSPGEMAQGCRGSLNLLDAKIETAPGNNIVIQPGTRALRALSFSIFSKQARKRESV